MKTWIAALLLAALASPALAQAPCDGSNLPNGPDSGADGPYKMVMKSLADPAYPGEQILVFEPVGAPGKRPVVFFSHGYGPNLWQAYTDLISHIVSLGELVVYAPYPQAGTNSPGRYDIMWAGFARAATIEAPVMDLTRVGFVGHSFGGGAVPDMAWRGLIQEGWGRQGAFLMLLAPWYSYDTPDSLLDALPAHAIRAEEIYDSDTINDHRMAIDIARHLPKGAASYFFLGQSGTLDGCPMTADHSVPGRNPSLLLKRLALYRPLDAIMSLSFEHSATAAAALARMGTPAKGYQPLLAVPNPVPDAPQAKYKFPWNDTMNPRLEEEPAWD